MLNKFRNDEGGFTLIELLVVILIIGILAAIALPTFLGQREKGQDSSAKSDARNLVTMVESCYTETQDYTGCTSTTELESPNGLNLVSDPANAAAVTAGAVGVHSASASGYTITAHSESGNTFSITKDGTSGVSSRSCTGDGGCNSGSW